MRETGTICFDTALGHCGLAWSGQGIDGSLLPHPNALSARSRLGARFPDRPAPRVAPAFVRETRDDIVALLEGSPRDLSEVPLDWGRITPFRRAVFEAARQIPRGATTTYGALAARIGSRSARAVGQALGANPFPILVPCHRILAADGRPGGFTAHGGVATKLRMLGAEGVWFPAAEGLEAMAMATRHLRTADPALAPVIDAIGPCRLERKAADSTFAVLAEAIVYQQLHGKAAATIFSRVCALMGRTGDTLRPDELLTVAEADLRAAGLSNAKTLALKDLAARTVADTIPDIETLRGMGDEAVVSTLTAVRGIGRWTVEMLLMFRLGRLDILPLDDLGVQQGYATAFRKRKRPTRQELARHGERWRPYRSVASWYFWRAAEQARANDR